MFQCSSYISILYWPPKPEAQLPEEVPPPAVHSVLVVQTPCFTLMSEVVHTSLGNWTMLNRENPRERGENYCWVTTGFKLILLVLLRASFSRADVRLRERERTTSPRRVAILLRGNNQTNCRSAHCRTNGGSAGSTIAGRCCRCYSTVHSHHKQQQDGGTKHQYNYK